jgi:nucleoside-diphosphate-sugar epimerase
MTPARIFVAGGTGTIGVPLVRALVAAGHDVHALTRASHKADQVRALGAHPAIADALDGEALTRVVVDARPSYVIHQLTALPRTGPRKGSDLAPTNRLRTEGTKNLIEASVRAGARRIVGGSFALFQALPPDAPREVIAAADAIRSMESQILDASRRGLIEGVVLRYGAFYGRGTPTTAHLVRLLRRRMLPVVRGDRGLLPFIHLDDAVSATLASLERAPAGSTYDIVDEEAVSMSEVLTAIAEKAGAPRPYAVPPWVPRLLSPFMAGVMAIRLPLSNARARTDLGWTPKYPTWREGIADAAEAAA